jgi:hypothetical protein
VVPERAKQGNTFISMISFGNTQNPFRKKKAHIFKKKKIIREKVHKNLAFFPSNLRVKKGVHKNIKKVGTKEQRNNLTIEPHKFRLFYIPKTERNKPRNSEKRKLYLLEEVSPKGVNRKPSLRQPLFLPPFLSQRKSLTDRYKNFFSFLPPTFYKKKGIRKTL